MLPDLIIVAKLLYSAPSPSTNPSPVTSTDSAVSGSPSKVLLAVADVIRTVLFAMFRVPSTITNSTFVKFSLTFSKSAALRFMLYVPASVALISLSASSPTNSKSSAVYRLFVIDVTL